MSQACSTKEFFDNADLELEDLPEFERIAQHGSFIIHCPGTALSTGDDNPTYLALISPE